MIWLYIGLYILIGYMIALIIYRNPKDDKVLTCLTCLLWPVIFISIIGASPILAYDKKIKGAKR